MSDFQQHNRPIQITVEGVPDDAISITGLSGTESISRLFRYTCELAVPGNAPLEFAKLLGKPVVVSVFQTDDQWRYVRGLFCKVTEGARDDRFISYTAELVPPLWMLTRNRRSRLFQQQTTEEIVRAVVGGLYDLGQAFKLDGTYHPRNICAQYQESDFDFFSRLLEEEGWYYYFTHDGEKDGIVISDNPRGHVKVPVSDTLRYQPIGTGTESGRVLQWTKAQSLRTASFTLTDHSFEMPPNTLEAIETLSGSVTVGTVSHPVTVDGDDQIDNITHPGGYVKWRDGIAPGGAERPDDLQHAFEDNKRLARVRAEEELSGAVEINGTSTFTQLTPGHTFTLTDHPDADGDYLVTSVRHKGGFGSSQSGGAQSEYVNTFTCIPAGVTYRPQRVTRKPAIHGTQTGVVVGSDGAEIDPDKYGRVKVWFRWDPAGMRGLDTSCWVRVATPWAGKQWGMIHIPRVGDEVVLAFENGDPDQPLIVGSLYNADNMPIYKLPDNKTQSGIKTHSSTGGGTQNYNEIKFEDKKGQELVSIHAEKDVSITVEDNYTVSIGAEQKDPRKAGKSSSTTFGDTSYSVTKGDFKHSIDAGKADYYVKGPETEVYDDTQKTTVTNWIDISSKSSYIHVTSPTEIKLTVGGSTITMVPDKITLQSPNIHFEAGTKITGHAPLIQYDADNDVVVTATNITGTGKTLVDLSAPTMKTSGSSEATHHGGTVTVVGDSKSVLTVGGSSVTCDPGSVKTAATAINADAKAVHAITGATVKLN